MKSGWKCFLLIVLIIFLDQASKFLVHFKMAMGYAGQIKLIGNWFKLYYVLNPGMAFGMKFGFVYGKLFLTVGRIIASVMIGRYIFTLTKKSEACTLVLVAWSCILGGAIGNVIDSVFYGVIFNNAPVGSITSWMHGQVIDMIFFDFFTFKMPYWMPIFSNQYITCFPVFNIADSFITIGVFLVLLKNKIMCVCRCECK